MWVRVTSRRRREINRQRRPTRVGHNWGMKCHIRREPIKEPRVGWGAATSGRIGEMVSGESHAARGWYAVV